MEPANIAEEPLMKKDCWRDPRPVRALSAKPSFKTRVNFWALSLYMNNSGLKDKKIAWISAAVLTFIVDRLFKFLAIQGVFDPPIPLIGDLFTLNAQINPYIAFSIPLEGKWLTLGVGIILLVLIHYLLSAAKSKRYGYVVPLLVLILGAASNFADRLWLGGVVDYMNIKYITVLNIADMMIVGGIMSIFYLLLRQENK